MTEENEKEICGVISTANKTYFLRNVVVEEDNGDLFYKGNILETNPTTPYLLTGDMVYVHRSSIVDILLTDETQLEGIRKRAIAFQRKLIEANKYFTTAQSFMKKASKGIDDLNEGESWKHRDDE